MMLLAMISVGASLQLRNDWKAAESALRSLASVTVNVSPQWSSLRFGPGLFRKGFAVAEVSDARMVRNRWYYGWGIRYTPHGWLFNVSGFDAVQIELRSGKKYRIGTDEPKKLCEAITAAIHPVES